MNAVSHTPLTPLSFLDRTARVWPDKPGIVYGNRSLSYGELATQATRVAQALRASGVQDGDRVAYLMPNLPEMLVAHFAVPLARAVLVAVNTRLSAEEIAYILDHSGAKVLVTDSAFLSTVAAAVQDVTTVTEVIVFEDTEAGVGTDATASAAVGSRLVSYADFTARGSDDPMDWSVEDELAPISINYTSGTTGRPKGVVYTHRGAYLNSFGEIVHSSHHQDSVYLWTLPMFHCNGWCTPWAVTGIGGTHVCLREVRGDAIWQQIRKHRVTHLNGAPTVVTTILNAAQAGHLDYRLVITTAGAPPSPTTILQMERMGFGIVHVYGLTETYGPYSVCQAQPQWSTLPPDERAVVQARQGVGMIQTEGLRVVDEDMVDVPADGSSMGEIVMRGNNVMAGYYCDPEGTAKAFGGGWFHSGDLGVMHPDGYVELRDRAKDVVISGGENISTIEVEQALMSHEAVLEVAVIGVPDEKWGERPKAFVVLKAGLQATEAELIEHVRTKIARYKAPRNVDLVTELPKTSTGKIQKFALREPEWAGRTHRVHG
ncbi:long-chain-fatty-acid--CoA ligase [Streptomyces sp. NBC_00554]|uniref:long-chain-fatty-acid--CoA ligase n=1 Tax=unclassified Streptomyces TaxID=2593676 RepID=UPI00225695AE|nr:long-chain-fatty-acid--CoA ligase [Streptomyces sp. NBC_00620]MCX4977025.1 long-chain-fatty-acid--CoA ligase [Streptomyces sp. NBC_00620]WUC54660.1 long-chain-fatty-acid--CoA ligase [Streptomyces sp. NBC_00554]